MAQFVSVYGVWVVAAFIALESIGFPLPAEAALIAAGLFAAAHPDLNIWFLIATGVVAAIVGEVAGFWIGRRFGYQLLRQYGKRFGLNEGRLKIGQWLFLRYGGRFVFAARFLPFLRNMAAVLAGTNAMAPPNFYAASATAGVTWVFGYGLASYFLGATLVNTASSVAAILGCAAVLMILATPAVVLRYEKRLLIKAERELARPAPQPSRAAVVPHAPQVNAAA